MTRLSWGGPGDRRYEAGVDRGVLYLDEGIPWNGLISVKSASSGGDLTPYYLDGVKYLNLVDSEEFTAALEAYTYPDEFAECDGTGTMLGVFAATEQERRPFGFSYRTGLGDDIQNLDLGYRIHLVYNALASPSEKTHATISDTVEPANFTWEITTTPIPMPGLKPSAHFVIDSTKIDAFTLGLIEDELYGSSLVDAQLISPERVLEIYRSTTLLLEIEENVVTGLSMLTESDEADLRGQLTTGLYSATPDTRLDETSTPGLYTLE